MLISLTNIDRKLFTKISELAIDWYEQDRRRLCLFFSSHLREVSFVRIDMCSTL
jgi:hypothetical protein